MFIGQKRSLNIQVKLTVSRVLNTDLARSGCTLQCSAPFFFFYYVVHFRECDSCAASYGIQHTEQYQHTGILYNMENAKQKYHDMA